MPRTWVNGGPPALNATNLNALEADVAAKLNTTDAATTYVAKTDALALPGTAPTSPGQVLTATSTTSPYGLAWNTPSGGGSNPNVVIKSAAYTAIANDYIVANGTFTITLPTPTSGVGVSVINAATGTITVVGANAATINGDGNATIVAKGAGGTFRADGTNWWVIWPATAAGTDTTAPTAPTNFVVTPGNTQNVLTWTASTDAVGVTGYRVRRGGTLVGSPTATTYTDTGLTNGTSYSYTVSAVDAAGNESAQTGPLSGTPAAGSTAPGAPTIGTATAGDASATVTFTAPASNGGSAITGYTATSSPGGLTGTSSTSPIAVGGLTNGTAYTFTVTATNAIGTGSASAASNSVTPAAGTANFIALENGTDVLLAENGDLLTV